MLRSFAPGASMELEDKFLRSTVGESKTDFAPPFSAEVAVGKIAQLLKNLGTMKDFARLVVLTGHGARSVNNPFIAACEPPRRCWGPRPPPDAPAASGGASLS